MAELAHVLRQVPLPGDPRLLVGAGEGDDAAVWRVDAARALVATADFFTPIVDDARTWGAIAAANALSDVYAMGGTPLFALNLAGWPRERLPLDLLAEVLAGGAEVAAEAGCVVAGGHTIDAHEPTYGLAVVGEAHPDRLLTHRGARPGDRLVLTKPLGTGLLATALKRDRLDALQLAPAVQVMRTLNAGASAAALAHGVRSATDVTGFGLLGHLHRLLLASGVGATLGADAVPALDLALELAAEGVVAGGTRRNLEAAQAFASFEPFVTEPERLLLADAQTSGGLLLAVPPDAHAGLVAALRAAGTPAAATIGTVTDAPAGTITVRRGPA